MAALAIGKEGGAKRGHGPPQTLKRLSICGFAKMSRSSSNKQRTGRGDGAGEGRHLGLPAGGKPAPDAGEADGWPCSPGDTQATVATQLPSLSSVHISESFAPPSSKCCSPANRLDPLPVPVVLSFPRLLTRLPFCPDLPTVSQLPSSANQPRQQESLLVSGSIPLRANACLAWRRHTQYI